LPIRSTDFHMKGMAMEEKLTRWMERLSLAFGAPGFEEDVVDVLKDWAGDGYAIEEDAMHNLRLYQKRERLPKTVMLEAHLDEVGFMVQSVRENGTLSFLPLGDWHAQNIPAHRVRVRTRKGEIPGVIAAKPPHFMTKKERERLTPISEMVIDVGAISRREAMELYGVSPGDPVVPDVAFTVNEQGVMLGKAFDCRVGCAAVMAVMDRLRDRDLPFSVAGAFSAQEEVGARGAKVNVTAIQPAAAIVFEGTPADDTFTESGISQGALGRGPQIRCLDRASIGHRGLIRLAVELAEEHGIPYQLAVRAGGGTDAEVIQTGAGAVPTLILGIPVRYAHSHHGYARLDDLVHVIQLAELVILNMNK
jgi:putative aminopeptidase FrvX